MAVPLTARAPIEFTPPSLLTRNAQIASENVERAENKEDALPPIKIIVRVPTMFERDAFAARLVRGGVVHYSQPQIRDLCRAGVTFLYPPEEFEPKCELLDAIWSAGDAMKVCRGMRAERYVELMEQQAAEQATNPKFKPMSEEDMEAEILKIEPDIVISDSDRVKGTAIQQDITSRYEPLQKAFADLAEQDIKRDWICVETYVVNWHGLEHMPNGDGRGGITRHEAEYLRQNIGSAAFDELAAFIFAMHSIDGDEEKNLASLIESSSGLTGSTASESRANDEPGNSTDELSTPTPDGESPKTIASSSSSTKRSARKTAK